MSGFEAKTAGW